MNPEASSTSSWNAVGNNDSIEAMDPTCEISHLKPLDDIPAAIRSYFIFTDLTLRRATSLAHVLRLGGKILENSNGSTSTYKLSEAVNSIDIFISHNWSTPRFLKFLTLACHFNVIPAITAVVPVMILFIVLTGIGIVPVFGTAAGKASLLCAPLGLPLIFLAMFVWHDLGYYLGCLGPYAFLDKICIHQTDPLLKRNGIESLGAFIHESKSFVMVYTNMYLKKLWTVFELASFLASHDPKDIVFLSTVNTQLVLAIGLWDYLMVLVYFVGTNLCSFNVHRMALSHYALITITTVGLVALSRWWAHKMDLAIKAAEDFRVDNAFCAVESDRPLVTGMIVKFMQSLQYVELDDPPEVALRAFENKVHNEVPALLVGSTRGGGGGLLPYGKVLFVLQTHLWLICDRIGGHWQDQRTAQYICAYVLWATTLYFALYPLGFLFTTFVGTRMRTAVAWWARAVPYVVVIFTVPPLMAALSHYLEIFYEHRAATSTSALGILAAIECCLVVLVLALYRQRQAADRFAYHDPSTSRSSSDHDGSASSDSI